MALTVDFGLAESYIGLSFTSRPRWRTTWPKVGEDSSLYW